MAPADANQLRLAISTLAFFYGDAPIHGSICGSVLWCQATRRLQRTLENPWRVDVIMIGRSRTTETCKHALVVRPAPELIERGFGCTKKNNHRGWNTGMPRIVILKWQLFGLSDYHAVFFADLDTDVMPVELDPLAVRARWRAMLPHFVKQGQLPSSEWPLRSPWLLGAADHDAPLNTGQFLLRPNQRLFRDGLQVLSRCRFNASHGWEYVGPPRALMERMHSRYVTGSAGGIWLVGERSAYRHGGGFWFTSIGDTNAHKKDNWRWVAAAEDQGFFWYMTALRHEALAYFDPGPDKGRNLSHYIHHYFGTVAGSKAWEGKPWTSTAHKAGQCSLRLGMNLQYLSRVEPSPPHERTPCHTRLAALRRTAEEHPLAHATRGGKGHVSAQDRRAASRCLNWGPPKFAIW
jgi:hypothetical protein